MTTERKLAKELLSAVWNEDAKRVEELIRFGADPSWIFNGYPILVHAVFTRNQMCIRDRWIPGQNGVCWSRRCAGWDGSSGVAVRSIRRCDCGCSAIMHRCFHC